jgi:hypothetical protein
VPPFTRAADARAGDAHIAQIQAIPQQSINFICSCFTQTSSTGHKLHSDTFSGVLCLCTCNLIGLPLVSIYQLNPKISVHFIMQTPVHQHLNISNKSTLIRFLKFPRQYEVFSPFFFTHSRSLSGILLMRPFTMWGERFSHTSSNAS